MSLKIPELQVMLPRANEVSRAQQAQLQENVLKRQEIASQMAHQTNKAENFIDHLYAREETLIRDKQERERRRESERDKEEKPAGNENKGCGSKHSRDRDSAIDILI